MTAYELRISDWSSDVCSSDLAVISGFGPIPVHGLIRVMLLRGRMRQAGHLSQGVREVIQEAVSHWVLQALRGIVWRSEEHTSELQSLMRISYAVFCLKKKNTTKNQKH